MHQKNDQVTTFNGFIETDRRRDFMEHIIKIREIESLTHDVKRFLCEKPPGFAYRPGQATELAINKAGWEDQKRPFTFTSLTQAPHLEFVIKIYSDHEGVTRELDVLQAGDELLIGDSWG